MSLTSSQMSGNRVILALCALMLLGLDAVASVEGTVDRIRPVGDAALELELVSETNRVWVRLQDAAGKAPELLSRVRFQSTSVPDWGQVEQLTGQAQPFARNAAELRRLGEVGRNGWCVADLNGQVLGLSPSGRVLAFQDRAGIILLTIPSAPANLSFGKTVHLQGNCLVQGARANFQRPPVVDNDDIHRMKEESGAVYLTSGPHQFRLDWFNRELPCGLEVYCEGPGLPRQWLPSHLLSHRENDPKTGRAFWTNGLAYRSYEGSWLRSPDFASLVSAKEGVASNVTMAVATRLENVGLEFSGCFNAPREGIYAFSTVSDDGSLIFIDEPAPSVEVTGSADLPEPAPVFPRQILGEGQEFGWVQVEGVVSFASERGGGINLELTSDTGKMRADVADAAGLSPRFLLNHRVRIAGICLAGRASEGRSVVAGLLAPGSSQIEYWDASSSVWTRDPSALNRTVQSSETPGSLPLLTQIEQVKRLTREQCQRGYPVRLRGVVTSVLDSGVFIQDAGWSIYARWEVPEEGRVPRIGDYWEIEGATFAEFAPNILVKRGARLGSGVMPEPLHPAWDQLINGSLDTEYVEIQGVITSVRGGEVTLLTRAGKLGLELIDVQPQAIETFANALIRVRGCVIPVRDIQTQQVLPGRIRLSNASITVDEPPPADPFGVPLKRASDLLLFDWRAGALQRVKISGQILSERSGEYFLSDGGGGIRFIPKSAADFQPGDLADVVGFLELAGPSPVLHEAVVRRVGSAKMPAPERLAPNAPLSRRYDATLVTVQGRLTGLSHNFLGDTLELQSGTRGFLARLKRRNGPLPPLTPGSTLELTGVYSGQGGDFASGGDITSFELLLNSPYDIKVLAQPSWWTVRRALAVLGGMGLALLSGLLWIAFLKRQVEDRSQQLAAEIRRHEQTERQRELESERARIARDLHDDLGAALTQIRFLSAVESRDARTPEAARGRMEQVSEKSREMVASLDEIVWAIDPANDSPASLANYLCHFAEEFFRVTPIRCRLDVADPLPSAPLTSEVRHHLYLAVREALNNIAKHSAATEAWLRIDAVSEELRIALEDNGRGFDPGAARSFGNGLANMQKRLESIGGRFSCQSHPGSGSICRLVLPLRAGVFDNGHFLKS